MFDIGFFELLLVGVVGLLVLGPERLPRAARTAGLWIGRIKRSVSGMQREINAQLEAEELRQKLNEQQKKLDAGLDKARRDVERYAETAKSDNDAKPTPPGSVARGDERAGQADESPGAEDASVEQAAHEPVESFTSPTDTDTASSDKDSAPR